MKRTVVGEAAAALAYLLLAVGGTWPVARTLGSRHAGEGGADVHLVASILEWVYGATGRGLAGFWDAPFYFPVPRFLAYSEILLGQQMLYAPVRALTGNPVLAFNAAYLGEMALCGYGAWLLARAVTPSVPAAFLAGALFELAPMRITHADHFQLLAMGFVPLTFLAWHRVVGSGRPWAAAALGAGYGLVFLRSIYLGLYLGVLLGLLVPFGLDRRWRKGTALAGVAMAASLLGLFLLHRPMASHKSELGLFRSVEENVTYAARAGDYLAVRPSAWISRLLPRPDVASPERYCYQGLVPLVLALVGIGAAGRRDATGSVLRRHLVLGAGAFVLSLGPEAGGVPLPYALLLRFVPGFDALRVPARFALLVAAALVPLAAAGAEAVLRRAGRRALPLALVLLAVHHVEAWTRFPKPRPYRAPADDPAYQALRQSPEAFAVLEVPCDPGTNARAMLGALWHGKPIVNGATAFEPPEHWALFDAARRSPQTLWPLVTTFRRGDVAVRRILFRDPDAAVRAMAKRHPGLFVAGAFGSELLVGVRLPEELWSPSRPAPALHWAPLPLPGFGVETLRPHVSPEAIQFQRAGTLTRPMPLRRGPTAFAVTLRVDDWGQELRPASVRLGLLGQPLRDAEIPWRQGERVVTPTIDVREPGWYELRIDVAVDGAGGARYGVDVSCVEVAVSRASR